MAINAVYLGEDSLIDLSNDTVEEMAVDDGVQFHDANGEVRQGARVIDDTMSDTSTNAPQNKVVKKYVDSGLAKKSNIEHTHDSADIVSGVLATDRIPTITNSKIQSLDASKLTGTVPSSVLPSYVDDVVEGYFYNDNFYEDSSHTTAITGETGKIYVSLDTNKTYRYSGSKFVVISETLALGETSSTAYRGDRGKAAYDHATAKGSAFSNVLGKVTTNAQGHVTGITTVTKADITALGIPAQDTTYDVATQSKAGLESAADKTKLDGIEANANAYSLPTATASVLGGVKTGSNITNTSGVISLTKANVTSALGYTPPTTNTTYSKATASTDGLESKEHFSKIEGIASGAEVNQNAFSNVTIGENTIAADSKTDTLTLVAGSNVTLTADTENDKVTIAAKDTTYSTATTSANGLMSASDKSKLDGITASADAVSVSRSLTSGTKIGTITINGTGTDLYCQTNTDTHYTTGLIVGASNTATANAAASNGSVYMNVLDNSTVRNAHKIAGSGSVTVSSDASGNITINGTNTTYSTLKNPYALTLSLNGTSQGAYDGSAAKSINITPSSIGALASNGNAVSATKATQDSAGQQINTTYIKGLSVSGKTITYTKGDGTTGTITTQDTNTTYSTATTSANGLMSASDKSKLDGIASGATKVTVDSTLSTSSTNPVQNKLITTELNKKLTSVPMTSSIYESYLQFGGRSLIGNVSPVDMAMSNVHSANRAQFCKPAGVTIEYTTDKGSTWTDYAFNDGNKINLLSDIGASVSISDILGGYDKVTVNCGLRITLNAYAMGIYTALRKILINISTGLTNNTVKIETATMGAQTTFTEMGTYIVSGWSGWNSIPYTKSFGGSSSQTDNINVIRMTFFWTGLNGQASTYPSYNHFIILNILLFGGTYWQFPSNMAKTGHLYSYDYAQNATFPAKVIASTFQGTATKATQDSSGQQINTTYIKGLSVSGKTITYTKGDGTTGTITTQDTNTTYSTATTSANGLMSASDKSKLDGIASGANAYSLPTATASVLGGVKVGSNITLSSGVISLTKANVTSALGYTPPTTNTTYSTATTSANGLMSASDKSKLDRISTITQGTLSAGSTSITLSNSNITESSVLDFYTSILGVNPLTIVPASGKVTLTFEAQSSAMTVGVRVCS